MTNLRILIATLSMALCGILLYVVTQTSTRFADQAPSPGPTPGSLAVEEAPRPQRGHDQKWVLLPFRKSALSEVPPAKTPGGAPLTLKMIEGYYGHGTGFTESGVKFDALGGCTTSSASCLDSGSSNGIARIVENRIEVESLTLQGMPTGQKCYCIPVWLEGRVFMLGASGDRMPAGIAEFCNAINWGDLPGEAPRNNRLRNFFYEMTNPAAAGVTSIPDAMTRCILRAPLDGKMLEPVEGVSRVNLGANHGVFVGQRLEAVARGGGMMRLRVLTVAEESCTVDRYSSDEVAVPGAGAAVHCEAKGAAVLGAK